MAGNLRSVQPSVGSSGGRRRQPVLRRSTISPAPCKIASTANSTLTGSRLSHDTKSGSSLSQAASTGPFSVADHGAPAGQCNSTSFCGSGTGPGDVQERISSAPDEVIMALDLRDGTTMGCAFFTAANGTLSLSEDMPMTDASVAEQFVIHVQPTTVIISARAPGDLLDLLKRLSGPDDGDGQFLSDFALRRDFFLIYCSE